MHKADKLQFVPDGPKLPLELINAHRKGKVIFFCGAGISAGPPMSLPLFPQLTACVLKHSGLPAQEDERLLFERGNYDEVLERRIAHLANGKARVRGHVRDMLTPAATRHNALHEHLLALARHDGQTRLVTTNYDHGFVWAGADQATFLNGVDSLTNALKAWNSIVYLHGRLPSNGDQGWVGSNIVLTTSDFGREYTRDDARAARFLCSIMKTYSVCFVGYSANDPIMRYLLTVSPDERQFQPRYLISSEDSPPATTGVTWIPYPKGQHERLEKTLAAWARATQSNWVSVINEHLSEHPKGEANANEPAPTDALVLHALSHHEAARAFCTRRPDIRWLTEYTPIARNSNDEVGWSAPPYIVTTAWPANLGDVPALAEWMTGHLISNEDDRSNRWRLLHWYWATHVEQYDAKGTFAALLQKFTARINRAPSELPLPWRCIHSPSQRTGTHSWDVSQLQSPIDSVAQSTRDALDQDFQPFIWFNNGEPTVRWNAD